MASKRQEYALVSLYKKLYKKRYGVTPTVNVYSARYGMLDAIESVGYEGAVDCLEYYFSINNGSHNLNYFFNNVDKIFDLMDKKRKDAIIRRELMERTRRQVEGE